MKISKFQFKDPHLTKFNFKINDEFCGGENIEIENQLKVEVKRMENEPIAIVSLNVIIGEASKIVPFFVNCEMVSEFTWENNVYDDDTVNSLLSINAPSLLLGYLRPIVSQITNLSQYPSYNIPFYNFLNND